MRGKCVQITHKVQGPRTTWGSVKLLSREPSFSYNPCVLHILQVCAHMHNMHARSEANHERWSSLSILFETQPLELGFCCLPSASYLVVGALDYQHAVSHLALSKCWGFELRSPGFHHKCISSGQSYL